MGIKGVHISRGYIGHGDQTLQAVFLIHDRQRVGISVTHQVPCIFHGHAAAHAVHPADAQILHLRADVAAQIRRGKAEIAQHKFCFAAEGAGTARLIMQRRVDLIFQIGIGDGRADTVRIRIAVADDQNRFLPLRLIFCHKFLFPSPARSRTCGAFINLFFRILH